MHLHRLLRTVKRHLRRTASFDLAGRLSDPRDPRGRTVPFARLVRALWVGALTAQRSLRAIEDLTERLGDRVADTTLHDMLIRLDPRPLRRLLVEEVKRAWRAKEMKPLQRFSMVAIDGKTIWVGKRDAHPACQRQAREDGLRWRVHALRACWVAGEVPVTVGQHLVPPDQNEMSAFGDFFAQLRADYGATDMLQLISLDAGYISEANARLIDDAGCGYLMALKNPQRELVAEAERVLGRRTKPDATSPWEKYRGGEVRRLLFRTDELAAYGNWSHLRQVWLARTETRRNGRTKPFDRYFVTNLTTGSTPDDVPLHLVRAHWGIENRSNWPLDVAWGEDDGAWAADGIEAVSLLRLLAANVVARLRSRRLRSRENRTRPWRNLIDLVSDVFVRHGAADTLRTEEVAACG